MVAYYVIPKRQTENVPGSESCHYYKKQKENGLI